jgi:hypothetical protein
VEVVENDDDAPLVAGEAVQELVDRRLDARPRQLQSGKSGPGQSGPHAIDGVRDVGPESRQVVVARVQRGPGGRLVGARREPRRDQDRLARACGTADHRQLIAPEPVQGREQSRALDHAGPQPRLRQLRLDQRQFGRRGLDGTRGRHRESIAQALRPFAQVTPAARDFTRTRGQGSRPVAPSHARRRAARGVVGAVRRSEHNPQPGGGRPRVDPTTDP